MPLDDSEQARWFEENLLPHKSSLESWLRGRFSSSSEIEDIVQESFLRVLKARERGPIRSPKALLYTTARNLALDYARSFRNSRTDSLGEIEDSSVIDCDANVTRSVSRKEELEIMTLAIQSLPVTIDALGNNSQYMLPGLTSWSTTNTFKF